MLQSTAAESHLPKERKAGGLARPWWMSLEMFGGGGGRESEGDSDTKKIGSNIHFEHQIWYPKESHKKISASSASMQSVKDVLRSPYLELLRTSLTDFIDPVEAEIRFTCDLYGSSNLHCKF